MGMEYLLDKWLNRITLTYSKSVAFGRHKEKHAIERRIP